MCIGALLGCILEMKGAAKYLIVEALRGACAGVKIHIGVIKINSLWSTPLWIRDSEDMKCQTRLLLLRDY